MGTLARNGINICQSALTNGRYIWTKIHVTWFGYISDWKIWEPTVECKKFQMPQIFAPYILRTIVPKVHYFYVKRSNFKYIIKRCIVW